MGPCFCVFAEVAEGAVGVSLANQTNERHKLVQSLRGGGRRGQRTSTEVRMFHPGKRQSGTRHVRHITFQELNTD